MALGNFEAIVKSDNDILICSLFFLSLRVVETRSGRNGLEVATLLHVAKIILQKYFKKKRKYRNK